MRTDTTQFNEVLWTHYNAHGRHELPWRQPESDGAFDPYKILVSELMLQQTQVSRVILKFHEFIINFPTVGSLATAPLADVLKLWSGLGYNRRAKFLWLAAQKVVTDYAGVIPSALPELISLPGVGSNTAGAILAYAYNEPAEFLETNVRTVYIHHFFNDQTAVPDKLLLERLQATLDREHPREFYWALMDYGSYLKQTVGNASKFSATYAKQSKFKGSKRQIRGQVLRALGDGPHTAQMLNEMIADDRLAAVLNDLVHENLINKTADGYRL